MLFGCTNPGTCAPCLYNYYSYVSKSCLPICPSGYSMNNSMTSCTLINSTIFVINFWNFLNFTATSIAEFSHPTNLSFSDPQKLSPIPTKDRGFYFANTSSLISPISHVLAPDFCVSFNIKVLGSGVILEVKQADMVYLKFSAINGNLIANLTSTNSANNLTSDSGISTKLLLGWFFTYVCSQQNSAGISIYIGTGTKSYSNYEFRMIEPGYFTIGLGFSGFISGLALMNEYVVYQFYNYNFFPSCSYPQYFLYGKGCFACTTQTWPLCVRSNSNNFCYSQNCSLCTGYDYQSCLQCSNGQSPPACGTLGLNCLAGSGIFNCSLCASGFYLIDSLCVLLPTFYYSQSINTPIFDLSFNVFAQFYGGIFQSGNNSNTYAPFNSPDPDDPYPVKNRGIYFTGNGQYLNSTFGITLNYKFSIACWVYPQNTENLVVTGNLNLAGNGFLVINITSYETLMGFGQFSVFSPSTSWYFYSFTVNFIAGSISMLSYVSNSLTQTLTTSGYYYQSKNESFVIGSSFNGFLYSLTVWNTDVYDFTSHYQICTSTSCLWSTPITHYLTPANTYILCETVCVHGCTTYGTCNQCSNIACSNCTSFNALCVPDNNTNPCTTGKYLNSVNQCCAYGCNSCTSNSYVACHSCDSSHVYLSGICITQCPSGYSNSSVYPYQCNQIYNPLFSFTFNAIQDSLSYYSGISLYTGNDTQFYPNGTMNDPIPAYSRGYYFTSSSFMKSTFFTLSPNFYISVWVWSISPGIFLQKNNLLIIFNSNVTMTVNNYSLSATFPSNWTNINFFMSPNANQYTYIQMSQTKSMQSVCFSAYIDTNSSMTIGDPISSFSGFLWQITYGFGMAISTVVPSAPYCSSVLLTNCFWPCNLSAYFDGTQCLNCSSVCGSGCRGPQSCSLCADPLCEVCENFTSNCLMCYQNAETYNGTCTCLVGFFWDSLNNQCSPCASSCGSCYGASQSNCLSCPANASLQANGTCQCETGYLWYNSSCVNCYENCLTCKDPSVSGCLSCKSTGILQANSTCQCPEGSYWNGTACDQCAETCLSCYGNFPYECARCSPNATLQNDHTCTCNSGYYSYVSGTRILCEACNKQCLTCKGSLSTDCISCANNSNLQSDDSCQCNSGFFWNGSSCEACSALCVNCSGPSVLDCNLCQSPLFLNQFHQCGCPLSQYWNGFTCESCDVSCVTCDGPFTWNCLSCPLNSTLLPNKTCSCNTSYYFDQVTSQCLPCHYTCLDCFGPSSYNCQSCKNSQLDTYLSVSSHSCQCGLGFYLSGLVCEPCNNLCVSCIDNSTNNCQCNPGFFSNNNYEGCKPCDPTCQTCDGPLSTDCLSCKIFSTLNNNGECHCTTGYFWSGSQCSTCHDTCESCVGPSQSDCSSCVSPLLLIGSECQCPVHSFLDQGNCQVCEESCLECFGPLNNNCVSCPSNSSLYPNNTCACNSSFYWDQDLKSCLEYNSYNISNSGTSLSTCADQFCRFCSNGYAGSCEICVENYENFNGKCFPCKNNTYFDGATKKCEPCLSPCVTCINKNTCTSCIEFSEIDSQNRCSCVMGYRINGASCVQNYFEVSFSIDSNNVVTLVFTEDLKSNLSVSDLMLSINNVTQIFSVSYVNDFTYMLLISFESDISSNEQLKITFNSSLISVKKSILIEEPIIMALFESTQYTQSNKINSATTMAKSGVSIGLLSLILSCIINLNPNTFFSFLSTAELFGAISMFNVQLDPVLFAFIGSLRVQKSVPNIFEQYFSDQIQNLNQKKFINYGITTQMFLLNSGVNLTLLISFITTYMILKILSKIQGCPARLTGMILEFFEYGVFLRLFIQTFFDVTLNSLIGIIYNDMNTGVLKLDYCICASVIIFQTTSIPITGYIIYLRLIKEEKEEKKYALQFSTFFEEFKDGSISYWLFYFIYIIRRFVLALLIILSRSGTFQLVLSFTFSITVTCKQIIFYTASLMPFRSYLFNFNNILNEIIISATHFSIFLSSLSSSGVSPQSITNVCINLITTAWSLNLGYSIFKNILKIYEKIKERRKKHSETIIDDIVESTFADTEKKIKKI